jgi:excinuclease ABC subunit A
MGSTIRISGARQHNLKNISLEIPRHQLVVITGVSGSGKSSLAFNTLYAEGQRRYVESLSAYARQFLDQLEKPDVDFIEGLSPAIAIEQRSSAPNPRSTIATTTEILDYLRVLYAAVGIPHDPQTGQPLTRSTPVDIVNELLSLPEKTRLTLLAPVRPVAGESFPDFVGRLKQQGFLRLRLDGQIQEIDDYDPPARIPRNVELVTDSIVVRQGDQKLPFTLHPDADRISVTLPSVPRSSFTLNVQFQNLFKHSNTRPELDLRAGSTTSR